MKFFLQMQQIIVPDFDSYHWLFDSLNIVNDDAMVEKLWTRFLATVKPFPPFYIRIKHHELPHSLSYGTWNIYY